MPTHSEIPDEATRIGEEAECPSFVQKDELEKENDRLKRAARSAAQVADGLRKRLGILEAEPPSSRLEIALARIEVLETEMNGPSGLREQLVAARKGEQIELRMRKAVETERDQARGALFECYVLSGEDTDGATTLAGMGATKPGIDVLAVRGVRQLRDDYDEALAAGGREAGPVGEQT